jgi:hypothetical protein
LGDVPYKISDHLADRMRQRGISEDWIRQVLNHPLRRFEDDLFPNRTHVQGYILQKGNRILEVVYIHDIDPVVCVTAFFK